VDRPIEKEPETSASLDERRELLNMASESSITSRPSMYDERRKELDEIGAQAARLEVLESASRR